MKKKIYITIIIREKDTDTPKVWSNNHEDH